MVKETFKEKGEVKRAESIHLLDKKRIGGLFNDANIYVERFFGIPKSLLTVRK